MCLYLGYERLALGCGHLGKTFEASALSGVFERWPLGG